MKKFLEAVGTLTLAGAAATGLVYYLQKKGIVSIEVNYDDEEGNAVSRRFDEIVDSAAANVGEKAKKAYVGVSKKVQDTAKGIKDNLGAGLDGLSFDKKDGITLPINNSEGDEEEL